MKRNSGMKTKWKWMTGLTAVLVVMFLVIFSVKYGGKIEAADGDIGAVYSSSGKAIEEGATHKMRVNKETIYFNTNSNGGNPSSYKYVWEIHCDNQEVNFGEDINGSPLTTKEGDGVKEVTLNAKNIGTATVSCKVYNASASASDSPVYSVQFTVKIDVTINEYIDSAANDGKISIKRLKEGDERKVIIMNSGAVIGFGTNAEQHALINLNLGDATAAEWQTTDPSVAQCIPATNTSPKSLKAVGAGMTSLTATYTYAGEPFTDTIMVYVKPTITDKNGNEIPLNGAEAIDAESGDIYTVSVFSGATSVGLADKIDWAIVGTDDSGQDYLANDSLGTQTPNNDKATLKVISSNSYKLIAKAGRYKIKFYAKGTYISYEEMVKRSQQVEGDLVIEEELVSSFSVKVYSRYKDDEITINLDGVYNIADALNIDSKQLYDHFSIKPSSTMSVTGSAIGATWHYIKYQNNNPASCIVDTKGDLGSDIIMIMPKDDIALLIPGVIANKAIFIKVTVVNRLTLNYSEAEISVGDENGVSLSANFDYNKIDYYDSDFRWTSSDTTSKYVKLSQTEGRVISIVGVSATKPGEPVKITLTWSDGSGISLVATCEITVIPSVTDFKITRSDIFMQVDGTDILELSKKVNGIVWLSSDESIVSVVDNSGPTESLAKITANKTGKAIITAFNKDNNKSSTCVVTVEQDIQKLAISINGVEKDTHQAALTEGIIFMKPSYQPKDATETEFTWKSDNEEVAIVDETGMVSIFKQGKTTISLKSKNCTAYCLLEIVSKPLTSITYGGTDPLNMVVGDTYDLMKNDITFQPVDATDKTLNWYAKPEGIVKVEGGKLTAISPGKASVYAEAVLAPNDGKAAVMNDITVNVRKGLKSIALDSAYYVSMGGKKQVQVYYDPDPKNDPSVNTKVKYKSSNEAIFKVDDKGLITPVKEGMAMLTVTPDELGADGAVTAIVYVTATEKAAKDFVISPEAAEIYIGDTLRLEKVFTPVDTTDQYVTWTSSDKSIATVNAAGIVTGVAAGETSITAVYNNTPDGKPWVRTSKIVVKPQPIHPTDFTVNPSTQNIKVNESFTLVPEFTPADTTNKNVEYQSLDEGVVKVDEKGKVTGVGAGDAIIQCQSEDGGFIATCAVHVENAVDFALSPAEKEIAVGRTFKITKIVSQANAKKTATWKSSNTAIATVDANGKVTAKRIGTCTITCKLSKYNQSASCKVKVRKLNSKVTLDKKNIRIGVGQTYKFKKTVWTNDTKNPAVLWRTSNKNVCAVNSFGKITGKKPGIVKITVMTKDAVHAKATCKVRVIQRVKSIRLNSDYMTLYVGRSKKLKATVNPKGATIKKLKFTSGDSKVARVMSSGKVRGISEGDTYITAKTTDGTNKKARCFVKVLDLVPTSSIVVAQSDLTMKKGDSAKLTYTVLPDNTSDNLKFASDNERVVKVDKKGKVTAVGTGNAVVTILAESGVSTTVNINVVALNKTVLNMRQYDTETLIVQGTSSPITWYSENQRVASVENGKVVGRAIGSTNIYAYVNGCKLTCRVTITSVNS